MHRQGLFLAEDSLIFRSDSNGEDLEGFAGAGLYDSVIAVDPQAYASSLRPHTLVAWGRMH
jgi:hypothetical protein